MSKKIVVKDGTKKNDSNLIEKLNSNFGINKTETYEAPTFELIDDESQNKEAEIVSDCREDCGKNLMCLNDNKNYNYEDIDNGPTEEEVKRYVLKRRNSIKELIENLRDDAITSRTAVAQNELDDNDIRVSKKYVEEILLPIKKELQSLKDTYEKKKIEAWNNVTTPVKKDGYAIASTNKTTENAIEKVKEHLSKYEYVNHPSHYNSSSIETIEKMRRIWGDEQTAVWCEMTAFKYRDRIGNKPDNSTEQEVGKIKWYEDKARELRNK